MTGQVVVLAPAQTPTPAAGGGSIPDVAMRPGSSASVAPLAGLLLVWLAGLAAITRRHLRPR
jgi:hypothetical protein